MTMVELAEAAAHLREDADFNRSWTDGRRGDREAYSEAYINRRLEVAAQRDRWADAIQKAINVLALNPETGTENDLSAKSEEA